MQRPASVTTFGVLNIIFAVLGLFCLVGTAALFVSPNAGLNPVARVIRENAAYAAWMKVSLLLGVAASFVLLAAGIGLLRLKPWARKLSIGYAIYGIIFSVLGALMNFLFLFRPMLAEAARAQGPEAAGAMGGAVGGMIGSLTGMIYPILLLVFMTRPKVVAAFQAPAEPPILPPA
jgi:hypothetical protein